MSNFTNLHMTDDELTIHRRKLHRKAARAVKSFNTNMGLHRTLKIGAEHLIEHGPDQIQLHEEDMIDELDQLPRAAQISTSDTFSTHLAAVFALFRAV